MAKVKNLKADKLREQLMAAILDFDYCAGRAIRWVNKLAAARTKHKRIERALAKEMANS